MQRLTCSNAQPTIFLQNLTRVKMEEKKSGVNYENADSKQDSLDNEKYNLLQTIDLCDLTFSSFNDIILGDCSYFEDVSVGDSGSDIIEKLTNTKSVQENFQENAEKNDSYNFYHVFEVINPIVREENSQTEVKSITKKSHKKSKKKRKAVTGAIRKGQRYLPNFKQKVLEYASNHTFKATALHFNINCNTITEWARERKRLSLQQKSTTSMPDSVCLYKTDVQASTTKTDIIIVNNSFTIETEFNDNIMKKIEKDLPLGDMKSDERFLEWIKIKRNEQKELTRNEVYHAAQNCVKMSNAEHPVWFILWLKRYEKSLQNSDKSDHETEKYIMYSNNFKLEVALYAKLFTKNSAARVFNVPRRRIFDWFKYSDSCTNSGSASALDSGSLKKDKLYAELHDWYQKKFSEGFCPNSCEIKMKAKELFMANGIGNIKFSEGWLQKFCKRLNIKLRHNGDDRLLIWILAQFDNNISLSHQEITDKSSKLVGRRKEFKGSKGWTLRFLKRHSKFLQKVPTIDDKLPDIVKSDIEEFWRSFKFTLSSFKINASAIGCMDEIPISFNYLQDGKSNLPLLRKTGFENCQAVVMLCMLADGRLLPPAVVLRGSPNQKVTFDRAVDMSIMYQEQGVVDLEVVEGWIEDIWLSFVPSPSVLIVDSFKPHCSPQVKEKLCKDNSVISIIPEGCSSQLQPLDIEITPKFKELIKEQWRDSPSNEVLNKKCRCPDQDTIIKWIRNAHRKIEENPYSIIKSFKVIGLID
ncbi:UNVERIFIED_CONTAM: hypothetical protein PYX00_007151 [Menopon gallinae]|uniref:HTH CENPB-type domain-containing protein n=1 Tax=Menopon gallinae TaxID=328185 RepID=A0AAW2HHT9_9NEOP